MLTSIATDLFNGKLHPQRQYPVSVLDEAGAVLYPVGHTIGRHWSTSTVRVTTCTEAQMFGEGGDVELSLPLTENAKILVWSNCGNGYYSEIRCQPQFEAETKEILLAAILENKI